MSDTLRVDPSNAAQLAAWDGDEGAYWAEHATRFDRSVQAHTVPFFDAARLGRTDRVLDVGCGTGGTTLEAAHAASAGHALGVDLSSPMLAHARQRAESEGVANVSFLQADAQIHPFQPDDFDVAIARTSAMFFGDIVLGCTNVNRALRPGGRIVLMTWQPLTGNPWLETVATALAAGRPPRIPPPGAGPFALSEPERLRRVLTEAGFTDIAVVGSEAPMWFGTDAGDASAFILGLDGWMLDGLDEDGRRAAREALDAATAAHETDDGVSFASATWITSATKP